MAQYKCSYRRTAHHATVFYDTRYFMLSTNFKIDEPRLNSAHTSYALQKCLTCISESNVPLNQFLILVLYTYIVCLFILHASSLILFFFTFFLTYLLTYLLFPLRIDPLRFPAVVYFVCCVSFSFCSIPSQETGLGKHLRNDMFFCRAGCKTTTQSINCN